MGFLKRLLGISEGISGTWITAPPETTADILNYFGRVDDREQIADKILKRYGTTLQKVKDASGLDTYAFVRDEFDKHIAADHIEIVNIGLGHRITSALATMFISDKQNFQILGPDDTSKAKEILEESRDSSKRKGALVQCNKEAVQVGVSAIFAEFTDGQIVYKVIDVGKIQACFDKTIESNGKVRPVNYCDLEDATVVVVETAVLEAGEKSFVAIFGRSNKYENGRYVSYVSTGDGREIPDPGEDGAIDYVMDGGLANPLSYYANNNRAVNGLPEYPIVLMHSGLVRRDKLFPISNSLLSNSLEADIAASHCRSTADKNSVGTKILTKSGDGSKQTIPKSLTGNVVLESGMTLDALKTDSSAPKIAWELLKDENISVAAGYQIPDYMISSQDHTVEAASGIALKVRTQGLSRYRDETSEMNAENVSKLFVIERSLCAMFAAGTKSAIAQLEACEETWDPGPLDLPEDETAKDDSIIKMYNEGIYDFIDCLRVKFNLGSDAEAIALWEMKKERMKKYPPLKNEVGNIEPMVEGTPPENNEE